MYQSFLELSGSKPRRGLFLICISCACAVLGEKLTLETELQWLVKKCQKCVCAFLYVCVCMFVCVCVCVSLCVFVSLSLSFFPRREAGDV